MRASVFIIILFYNMNMRSADAIFQRLNALKKGEEDTTTIVEVSVMVYYTPAFLMYVYNKHIQQRRSPPNRSYAEVAHPVGFIENQIEKANTILQESEIPVKLKLFCTEELNGFVEAENSVDRLGDFMKAKSWVPWTSPISDTLHMLNTADIGKKLLILNKIC